MYLAIPHIFASNISLEIDFLRPVKNGNLISSKSTFRMKNVFKALFLLKCQTELLNCLSPWYT